VLGERIVAVGSAAEVDTWHGPADQSVDAQGRLLLPGFNDAHVHLWTAAIIFGRPTKNAASPVEFARRWRAREDHRER